MLIINVRLWGWAHPFDPILSFTKHLYLFANFYLFNEVVLMSSLPT